MLLTVIQFLVMFNNQCGTTVNDTIFFSQRDDKWKSIIRYHSASDALQELDQAVLECLNDIEDKLAKKEAKKAFNLFHDQINDLIEKGMDKKDKEDTSGYSIFNFGCWDCTLSMVIANLGGKLYDHQSSYGKKPKPDNFVKCLRSWQILSPIGFYYDIFNDPISTITKGEVQLYLHEDYGWKGSDPKESLVFQKALDLKGKVGIAVCVKGHPFTGNRKGTHWVYIDPTSTKDNIKIFDPDTEPTDQDDSSTYLKDTNYDKVFEVCVYSTPVNFKEVFKC